MTIAVDFDGTVVEWGTHRPMVDVPGAVRWLREWVKAGAQIVLWTVRCDSPEHWGPMLQEAVDWYARHGIPLHGVNGNPSNPDWYTSPKPHVDLVVDDINFGIPLRESARVGGRAFVDWDVVGPAVLKKLLED
jgi:hypothetical protein